ncbi:MAG TPA: HTH domain-containing protein [candidate division Zixibacteria bacterium]|nr:HTH domain-containing protein [candidate division Zixibacteria bacterium]
MILAQFKSAKEPMKAGEIAEACGLDKKEVDKVIAQLKKDGKIDSPKRCFYAIKK